jgi:glutathionylspermidine synthase
MTSEAQSSTLGVCLQPLARHAQGALRRRLIFEGCKWDPQVGDVDVVGDHAVLLAPETAQLLAQRAERLAAEVLEIERRLLARPDLHARLALARPLRRSLRLAAERPPHADVRLMRFDFHPTPSGWLVSEVNSDVPGGYAESVTFARLAAEQIPAALPTGDVVAALVAAWRARLAPGARIALVHATAYSDDRQVMTYLSRALASAGLTPLFVAPDHLRFSATGSECIAIGQEGPVHGIARFYPGEWLPELPRESGWNGFFTTPLPCCNPPSALLTQSKRMPLVLDALGADAPAWRALVPCSAEPRAVGWRTSSEWVFKPTWGRAGEDVAVHGAVAPRLWRAALLNARMTPRAWVAQRRFASLPVAADDGPRHLTLGVFVVDGRAAGCYARAARRSLIDASAQDLPVLIRAALH